jgi:hypothetical protein
MHASWTLFRLESHETKILQNETELVQKKNYAETFEAKTIRLAKLLHILNNVTLELALGDDLSSERKFDIYYKYVAPVDFEMSELKRTSFKEEYTKYSLSEFLEDLEEGAVDERIEAYHEIFIRFIAYKEDLFLVVESAQLSISQLKSAVFGLKKDVYLVFLFAGFLVFLLNIGILIQTQLDHKRQVDND